MIIFMFKKNSSSRDSHEDLNLSAHRTSSRDSRIIITRKKKNRMSTDFKSIPLIDIGPLLAKCDDPKMGEDPGVADVVRQLDQACREAGFFYVVSNFLFTLSFGSSIPTHLLKVRTRAH